MGGGDALQRGGRDFFGSRQEKFLVATVAVVASWREPARTRIKYLEGEGHISSFLFKQAIFREAIYEALDMLIEKLYKNDSDKPGRSQEERATHL